MEAGRKILIYWYISLQAREATYSCSGPPVTGTRQPSTNALHQDHNKVFLFITPSTQGMALLNHQGAGMMMSSVSQQMVINQIHRLKEAPPQATLRWLIEDAVRSSDSK